jgi:hypothetical protein
MGTTDLLTLPAVHSSYPAATAVAPDVDFDTRWAAWIERGRVHDQRVRRRFVVWAGVVTVGVTIVYAFLRFLG